MQGITNSSIFQRKKLEVAAGMLQLVTGSENFKKYKLQIVHSRSENEMPVQHMAATLNCQGQASAVMGFMR